ncbi:MAG: hydroxyectoine utilization dehydratase EutB [Geminicoccaceae bacterium]
MTSVLQLADVYRARAAIAPWVRRTPLVRSDALARTPGRSVHLKLETLQETGSFKLRGATNRMLALSAAERERGVVAVSTGNHARAVAHAARSLNVPAAVFMSTLVPQHKVEAVRAQGAEVRIVGEGQDAAEADARRLAKEQGRVFVSPFEDPLVIAGQGTIGLELLEDLPDLDTALVPLSGGGLIGGIAVALKSADPAIRVIGVSMERGAAMYESLRAGRPVDVVEEPSLADSLGGGIGLDNRHTFALVRDLVDEVLLVSEDEIAAAMAHCYWHEQQIVEGGAAVGVAALLAGKVESSGERIAVVLSGRNVDMRRFTELIGLDPGPGARAP